MQTSKRLPSVKYLCECFDYDPRNGELRWRARPRKHFASDKLWRIANTRCAGKLVGWLANTGYCKVTINHKHFMVHRIIWKMVNLKDPLAEIDHIDRDRSNNRWVNLRIATQNEQRWNSSFYKNNKSGFRGVWQNGSRWRAGVRANGVIHHLGYFDTKEEASAVYQTAARKLHGEFYRG